MRWISRDPVARIVFLIAVVAVVLVCSCSGQYLPDGV